MKYGLLMLAVPMSLLWDHGLIVKPIMFSVLAPAWRIVLLAPTPLQVPLLAVGACGGVAAMLLSTESCEALDQC